MYNTLKLLKTLIYESYGDVYKMFCKYSNHLCMYIADIIYEIYRVMNIYTYTYETYKRT